MGKRLKHEKSSIRSGKYDHKTGWFAGMLHVLDYHHWRTKHWRKHRPICWGTPRTHSLARELDEKQPFLTPMTGDSKLLAVAERSKRQIKAKNKITKDFSHKHVKEYMDIIEILENKDIFVKILKNPDSGFRKQFQIKQNPRSLTKSGSFPLSGSSRAMHLRPTRLEDKQKEHWYAPKGDSSVLTLYVPRFGVSGSSKEQNQSSASPSSSGRSDDHGFSHAVMNGFREVKKWLKNILKDRKNKKKLPPARTHEMGDLRRKEFPPVRRAISLNDSLDRYSQLIEQSFRREARLHSKSLKLSNEENKSASKSDKPKFFRRISSLSSLESLGPFLTELSHDSTTSNLETRKSNFGTKKSASQKNTVHELESRDTDNFLERPVASESDKDIPMASDFPESILLPRYVVRSEAADKEEEEEEEERERSHEDHTESNPGSPERETEQQDPDSVPTSSSFNNTARRVETSLSEGSDPNSREIQTDAQDSLLGLQSKSDCRDNPEELFGELSIYNHEEEEQEEEEEEKEEKEEEEEEEEEDTYLCFVKNVLELSGFLTNKDLGGQWHSEDQPLNPSLLCKLEPCIHEEDAVANQLLFDLVNEAVVETYNQSHIYFPQAFSFTRRVYPRPKGKHLLDDVWGRVQWNLSGLWANKKDCSLDDLVARDLGKADGWMNVQAEAEWLALELEDLIFYEILDDLVFVRS